MVILKDRTVTDFQLMTVFTEIEDIINSRSCTLISQDVNDLEALTLNHLLMQPLDVWQLDGNYSANDLITSLENHKIGELVITNDSNLPRNNRLLG